MFTRSRSVRFLPISLLLVGACDMPVSTIDSTTQSSAPYVPPPAQGDDLPSDNPWDLPYDKGTNPYYWQTDSFNVVNKAKQVDVLFVMDNSGSMAEEQAGVVDSFSKFLEGFTAERIDYHVGVVATDSTSSGANGWTNQAYTHFPNRGSGSLLAYSGNPRFISVENGRSEALRQFRLNASLGTQGSGAETGLLAVINSLSPAKIAADGWNAGFYRSDAMLSVVIVSDEDESIGGTNANYLKTTPAAETTRINAFVDTLKALKPNRPDLLRLDLVIGPVDQNCNTAAQRGDTYTKAFNQLYAGATQVPGKILNICQDFSGALGDLGAQIAVQVERRFKIKTPVQGELKVKLNGQEIAESATSGYTYDSNTHEITLHGLDLESMDGFTVEARYIASKEAP